MKRTIQQLATGLVCLFCAGCATYNYTQKGIELTSEPSGAKVVIQIVERGSKHNRQEGGSSQTVVTPFSNPKGAWVRNIDWGVGGVILCNYTFVVTKEGYDPIIERYDGENVPTKRHWILKPRSKQP